MLPTDAGTANNGRTSPSTTPNDVHADAEGEGGTNNNTNSFSHLKPSLSASVGSPSLRTSTNAPETMAPVASTALLISPLVSPRGAQTSSLEQESVSVIVRLKGAPARTQASARCNEKPSTPASLSYSPRSMSLLYYTVEDGALTTPRTSRRPASRSSGLLSPRPQLETSLVNNEALVQLLPSAQSLQQGPSSEQTSPYVVPQGHNGTTVFSSSQSSTPSVAVTLPRAFTATPSAPVFTDTSLTSLAHAAGGPISNSSQLFLDASGYIGCRGRVLTIQSATSDNYCKYEFGEVFEPDVTNAALCERLLPAIMEQLEASYNVCVLCYGQTGSGKTYTMNALVPAIAHEIFRTLDANNEVVEMSYIQIYNNKAYNLLDGSRAAKYGAELSKPLQTAMMTTITPMESNTANNGVSNNYPSSSPLSNSAGAGAVNSVAEPKVLVRSAAEVLSQKKAAGRRRVTHAHALNPRSSRSFTFLTLHVTRFLEGAPLTTTRVTLADLAGTEHLKSGATSEGQSHAIFINKSLMALRELVESSNTDSEVLHFRDSLLATYLAPRMRSWHLFLLVTVSLEVGNYEATKSSLDFATNARRRRIKKLKCRTADHISGLSLRLYGNTVLGGYSRAAADVAELQAIVESLQYRISMLEESLKVAQLQRAALSQLCGPFTLPRLDGDHLSCGNDGNLDMDKRLSEEDRRLSHTVTRLRESEVQIGRLRQECLHFRQLLREREEELWSVQTYISPEVGGSLGPAVHQELSSSLVSSTPAGPYSSSSNSNQRSHHHPHRRHSSHFENGTSDVQQQFLSSHSSLSASIMSSDALASSTVLTTGMEEDTDMEALMAEDGADAHVQLKHIVSQLCSGVYANTDPEAVLERLRDAVLRAKEQDDDVRERLLVLTSTLAGLRAQNHELHGDLLKAARALVAQDEEQKRYRESLERERLRASAAEAAVDQLRLQLFRALAEQTIGEELTRLYLDEQHPTAEAVDALSGVQLAEHREEMEKFETHQHALQDKITELVNTVEQLTRAGLQKDISLAALESIITPAQRALFHTMSSARGDSDDTSSQFVTAASAAGGGAANEESTADCFSLLQSRVSELESLLQRERQQHQLTHCEVVEAREDARRSRQEQRQAFFQQQEEERRVAQLTAENFDLRQQNERHQMYLDQIHVHFQEQLLELRCHHVAELAEQRRRLKDAHQQVGPQKHTPHWSRSEGDMEEEKERETTERKSDTACGRTGPPSQDTNTTAVLGYGGNNNSTRPQSLRSPMPKAGNNTNNRLPHTAAAAEERKRKGGKNGHGKKPRSTSSEKRIERNSAGTVRASRVSSHTPARREKRLSLSQLNPTQPPFGAPQKFS